MWFVDGCRGISATGQGIAVVWKCASTHDTIEDGSLVAHDGSPENFTSGHEQRACSVLKIQAYGN